MFGNLTAFIAPKSFNLENFLSKSKPYTSIKPWLARRIKDRLNETFDDVHRIGECATAIAYSSTVVTITDDELAQNLFTVVNQQEFWEKASLAERYFEGTFSNLKFFVNEKEKKVLFISYDCNMFFTKHFLKDVFDKVQYLCNIFSTENYKIKINYANFFKRSFFTQTSFLSSFFTSIVTEGYEFNFNCLMEIAGMFLCRDDGPWNYQKRAILPWNSKKQEMPYPYAGLETMITKGLIKTIIPGMYVNHLDHFFENTLWPRNICINILRLAYGKTFSSFESFFATCPEPANNNTGNFNVDENFVYDEQLLLKSLTVVEETDEFITYFDDVYNPNDIHSHTVIKVKDGSALTKYVNLLGKCLDEQIIQDIALVTTPDNTSYYLFFNMNEANKNLKDAMRNEDITALIQIVADKNWCFKFKSDEDMVDYFVTCDISSEIYLKPSSITKIDFDSDVKLDWRLLVLQIAKARLTTFSKIFYLKDIYSYSFMKILPYTFARHLIDYIKTGVFEVDANESWGLVLKSEYASKIQFLENFSYNRADYLCFFAEAKNHARVVKLTKNFSSTSYTHSEESIEFVKSTGRILSDDVLNELFEDSESNSDEFLSVRKVIVSHDFSEDGNYKIIGVEWYLRNLNTLDSLIAKKAINSQQLHIMICSLLERSYSNTCQITEGNIGKVLVDPEYNVYFDRNVIETNCDYLGMRPYGEQLFCFLADLFKAKLGKTMWNALDHFTYSELVRISGTKSSLDGARNLTLCTEHNHYHLPKKLCVECEKVYELINSSPERCNARYFVGHWVFYSSPNDTTMVMWSTGERYTILNPKLGIENHLFDSFFFKPIKIAKTPNNEYGVVFNKIDFKRLLPLKDFKNIQRLKVVLVLYKKLLPYILDGSFITSHPDMFSAIAMHKDYKGEILILRIPFMECNPVLDNTEFKATKMAFTQKLFAEFLVKYITDDEALKRAMDIEDSCVKQLVLDIQNMNFNEEVVRKCLHSFCDVHKLPISRGNNLCPLCKASGISEEDIVVEQVSYFNQLTDASAKYEGGEASLYPYGNNEVQKLFKEDVDLVLKSKILGKALEKAPLFREFNAKHPDIQFVTINKILYMKSGSGIKLKGFIQNCIDESFKISCLRDKEFLEKHNYTINDVIDIFIKICIGIEFLHSIGGYIGDLNGGNILIKNRDVYFIDMDGMSFDDVRNFVYTDTYIYPPSAKSKNITKSDDWYSLAVQVFYCLTHSHPFRGICSNSNVPDNEVDRMEMGLSVLGNHGITPPSMSIGWSFLPKSLVDFFLNTFEWNKRESMRTVLESYRENREKANSSKLNFEELKRKYPCHFALSYNTYISQDGFVVWCENKVSELGSTNVKININGGYFTFLSNSKTVVLNDSSGSSYTFSAITNSNLVCGISDKVFYASEDRKTLYMKKLDSTTGKEVICAVARSTTNRIINFMVTNDHKFIFLEEESATQYAVYCNLDRLTSIDITRLSSNPSSSITYDEVTEKYMILVSDKNLTIGLVISKTGSYNLFSIPMELGKCSCFFSNTLYFVSQDKLFMYNLSNGSTTELPECYVTSKSLIQRESNKFLICTGSKAYMFVKSVNRIRECHTNNS